MTTLIEAYLAWLHRAKRASPRTIADRRYILAKANRELPYGLERADEGEISEWEDNPDWSPWTLSTYDTALRGIYTWAVARGYLWPDPMAELGRPGDGPRIAAPPEDCVVAVALTAPRWPWRRAVMLAAYAGLRCGEICSITTDDIIGDRLRVFGKGKRYRVVPIGPELADELEGTRPGHLLVGKRGRPIGARVLTQMQRPVWQSLGLPETLTLHKFRHWFATRLIETGADIRVVQDLLGHANVNTTQGYTSVTDRRMMSAVRALPKVQSEPVSTRLGLPPAA